MIKELDYKQARKTCPENFIECTATNELEPLSEIIGQARAVKALQFGLDIMSPDDVVLVFLSGDDRMKGNQGDS